MSKVTKENEIWIESPECRRIQSVLDSLNPTYWIEIIRLNWISSHWELKTLDDFWKENQIQGKLLMNKKRSIQNRCIDAYTNAHTSIICLICLCLYLFIIRSLDQEASRRLYFRCTHYIIAGGRQIRNFSLNWYRYW